MPGFHFWRTVLFLMPTIGLYTIVFGSLSLLFSLFDDTGRRGNWCPRLWARLILITTGVRVDVRGLDRLVPGTTYVFVSNHQSIYDIPVLFWYVPYQLRIIAKDSLGRVPFVGWHLRRSGNMLVDRSNPDRTAILEQWRALVRKGLSLIIFAEGTRSVDGRVGRFKAGAFQLAIEAGLPVVPLTIVGTRFVMRKGEVTVRPGFVELTVLDPVPTNTGEWAPTFEDARRLAETVQNRVMASIDASERAHQPWPAR